MKSQHVPCLPADLAERLDGYACTANRVGCSTAMVYRYHTEQEALYLKIARADDEIHRERALLHWLRGRLPVPMVKYFRDQGGLAYLLMTEIPGEMCCVCPEDSVRLPVESTVKLLADGLMLLQAVDISDCPFDQTLDRKLQSALLHIENGLVDMADFAQNGRFDTPMALYNWLLANRPPEAIRFTHGDYCLPNIFIEGGRVTGFIDVGRAGLADLWQDIALCVRSLRYNLRGAEQTQRDAYIGQVFSHLGIAPDWEKIEYYILLDELF